MTFVLQAQDGKLRVAVFDPSSSGTPIDEGTKVAVREIISSTFVNMGKYTIVERSLLQQVMKEQAFSNSDVVDDSQATELGRLAGANKVVLSVLTLAGGRNMLSIKIIDVKTATIDQQKTKIVTSNDLLDFVEPLTLELLGQKVTYTTATNTQPVEEKPAVVENKPLQQDAAMSTMFCGFEIMVNDLPGKYKWYEAQRACPQGWRLPTSYELKCLCENKKRIGGFNGKQYWTSEMSPKKNKAISRTFNDCKVEVEDITDEYSCRCVR